MYDKLKQTINQGMVGLRWYVASHPDNSYTSNAWNCPVARWLQDAADEDVMVRTKCGTTFVVAKGDDRILLTGDVSTFVDEFDTARHEGILPIEVSGEELLLWMNR